MMLEFLSKEKTVKRSDLKRVASDYKFVYFQPVSISES